MNTVIETILKRRSIRKYKEELVKKEELELILKCGLYAPSSMDSRSWHFTLIHDPKIIQWINDENVASYPPAVREEENEREGSIFFNAHSIILVSKDNSNSSGAINASLAVENICIAAESLGIGTCIIGLAAFMFQTEKASLYEKKLKIPEGYKPIYAITVGYPDEAPETPDIPMDKVTII